MLKYKGLVVELMNLFKKVEFKKVRRLNKKATD